MLNSGVLGIKSKLTINKVYYVTAFLLVSIVSALSFNTSSASAITQAECESAGGKFTSTYVGGSQGVANSCDFQYSNLEEIASYSYYNAISQCSRSTVSPPFVIQWKNSVSEGNVGSPAKWMDNAGISVGYIVDGQDGVLGCSEMITKALNMWGYPASSYQQALQSFGYTKQTLPETCDSSYNCTSGGVAWLRGSDTLNKFQTTIKNRVYGGSAPTLEGREELLYLRAMVHIEKSTACAATPYKKMTDLSAEEKTKYVNNDTTSTGYKDYLIVSVVNGTNWTVEKWVYKIDPKNWSKLIKVNEAPSGGSVDKTCVVLARETADYAQRIANGAASMIAAGLDPATKYGEAVKTPGQSGVLQGTSQNTDETETTCVVEAIGWIICPVVNFMAELVDAAYGFVSALLVVQPLLTTGDSGIYGAWSIMRNIANVAFVLSFLIIIFSQITGVGISNYGIKKTLPRLIVVAILVNVSFWICAIAVDLSNIIGSSAKAVFDGINLPEGANAASIANTGEGWAGIAGALLAGTIVTGAALYVGLSALIPAIIAAALAILTVFIVLTLRQALIILLVVISPIAFVAFLLPNTESLFNKWRGLLMTLLLMYPIIAGIFGASALASKIVMGSANHPVEGYNIAIQIMGALIAILPLALTPIVMKFSGGVLNRFGGIVNNVEKGPVDAMKKRAGDFRERRQNVRAARSMSGGLAFGGGQFRRKGRRDALNAGAKNVRQRAEQQYIADSMIDKKTGEASKFAEKMAGGGAVVLPDAASLQRALAGAQFTIEKAELEDVKAEQSLVSNLNMDNLKAELSKDNVSAARSAAIIDRMIKIGDPGDYEGLVNQYGREESSSATYQQNAVVRDTIASSLAANGPKFLKAADLDSIRTGSMVQRDSSGRVTADTTFASMAEKNIADGVYSEENIVSESNGNLDYAFQAANLAGKQRMVDRSNSLMNNPTLSGKVKHNATSVERIMVGERPNPNPQADAWVPLPEDQARIQRRFDEARQRRNPPTPPAGP